MSHHAPPTGPTRLAAHGLRLRLAVVGVLLVPLVLATTQVWAADAPAPAPETTKQGEEGDVAVGRRLTEIGIAFQKKGDHMAAIAYFDRALQEVDHPKIRYFRAKSLHARGDYDDAFIEFHRIRRDARVAKYSVEISAFIRAIEAERERRRLERELARERKRKDTARRDAMKPLP